MNRLIQWLDRAPLITDGAWGTELQKLGLAIGELPDRWNLTHPERVESVARSYVQAGSNIILTNTFRANSVAMKDTGAADLDQINRAGVTISKTAAKGAVVFASMGPTGRLLASGEIGESEIFDSFAAQSRSLASAGADALLIETMSDIDEARIAVSAARRTGLPVIASFAFNTGKNKDRTLTGATPRALPRP